MVVLTGHKYCQKSDHTELLLGLEPPMHLTVDHHAALLVIKLLPLAAHIPISPHGRAWWPPEDRHEYCLLLPMLLKGYPFLFLLVITTVLDPLPHSLSLATSTNITTLSCNAGGLYSCSEVSFSCCSIKSRHIRLEMPGYFTFVCTGLRLRYIGLLHEEALQQLHEDAQEVIQQCLLSIVSEGGFAHVRWDTEGHYEL